MAEMAARILLNTGLTHSRNRDRFSYAGLSFPYEVTNERNLYKEHNPKYDAKMQRAY